MDFATSLKKILKTIKADRLKEDAFVLDSFRKDCACEQDVVQYVQLKILLDVNGGFLYRLYEGNRSNKLSEAVETVSQKFDGAGISATVYAYYIYAALAAFGVSADPVAWVDPTTDGLVSPHANNKTFGVGAYMEPAAEYTVDASGTLKAFSGSRALVTVPYGIKKIEKNAFAGNSSLAFVTLSQSVAQMASGAFSGCGKLQIAVAAANLTEIPDECFSGCKGLTLVIATGVKKVGKKAFLQTDVANIKRIGNGKIEAIEAFGFAKCKRLKTADIASVKTLGAGAFAECTEMTTLALSSNVNLNGESIRIAFAKDDASFKSGGYKLTEITVNCADGNIPDKFFAGLSTVEKIKIVGSVKRIGVGAFKGCDSLRELDVNFVGGEIADGAFEGTGLVSLKAFENATKIGANAFAEMKNVRAVAFKNPVESIGDGAFKGCELLESADFTVKDGVLPVDCFSGCKNLKEVTALKTATEIRAGALSGCSFTAGLTLGAKVKKVERNAFKGCKVKGFLSLPAGVAFEKETFAGIEGVTGLSFASTSFKDERGTKLLPYMLFADTLDEFNKNFPAVENIKIEGNNLDAEAFKGWTNVKKALVSGKASVLPKAIFKDCVNLEGVKFAECGVTVGEEAFAGCKNLKRFRCASGDDSYEFDLSFVKEIGGGAFLGCEGIETLALPSSCLVAKKAFAGCAQLTSLSLYKNDKTETPLSPYVFFADSVEDFSKNYNKLVNISLRGFTAVSEGWLKNYTAVKTVSFGVPVEKLGEECFAGCTALETVRGAFAGENLPASAFEGCVSLKETLKTAQVKRIGDKAFKGCKALTALKFSENGASVESIGVSAFEGCESLAHVSGNFECNEIGVKCFYGCLALKDYSFIKKAKVIREGAFENSCFSGLPSGVEEIEKGAFKGVKMPQVFVVPSNVSLEEGAFEGATGFTTLVFEDAVISNKLGEAVLPYALFSPSLDEFLKDYPNVSNLKLSGGLYQNEFQGWTNIKKVLIEKVGNEIPENCFAGCTSLEGVKVTESDFEIGAFAFNDCKNLKRFITSDGSESGVPGLSLCGVTGVGVAAFRNCELAEYIEISLDGTMEEGAFNGCTNVKTLSIFGDVTDFTVSRLFAETTDEFNEQYAALQEIKIKGTRALPDGFFAGMKKLKTVRIEGELETLGEECFKDCAALTLCEMTFVGTALPVGCFENCVSLDGEFSFEKVGAVGARAFFGAENIKAIKLGETSELGEKAFYGCKSLEKVDTAYIGTEIASGCFYGCSALKEMPEMFDVVTMAEDAFEGCGSIETLKIGYLENAIVAKVFNESAKTIREIIYRSPYVGNGQFSGLSALEKFVAETPLERIGDHAFYGVKGLAGLSLESATHIGDYAFARTDLKNVTVGEKLERLGVAAFAECYGLETLRMPLTLSPVGAAFDWREDEGDLDKVIATKQYVDGTERIYYIPKSLKKLTLITDTLEDGVCSGLSMDVEIIGAPTEIGADAFNGFTGKLVLDTSKVEKVGENAFASSSVQEIRLPLAISVGKNAFACSGLKTLELGNSLENFGEGALAKTRVDNIAFSGSERYSFTNGTFIDLKEKTLLYVEKSVSGNVVVGEEAEKIAVSAFEGCKSLVGVQTVNVKEIGDGAFENCENLTKIVFSDSLEKIGERALYGCEKVNTLKTPFLGASASEPNGIQYLFGTTSYAAKSVKTGGYIVNGAFGERDYETLDLSEAANEKLEAGFMVSVTAKQFTLPEKVVSVAGGAFENCTFDKLSYGGTAEKLSVTEDCIYYDDELLYRYKDADVLTVKETAKGVYAGAFDKNFGANEIVIKGRLSQPIQTSGLFDKFDRLTAVSVYSDVWTPFSELFKGSAQTLTEVKYYGETTVERAFANLPSVTAVTAPNVKELSAGAFENDVSLQTVAPFAALERLDKKAFTNCPSLTALSLPSTLKAFDEDVFDELNLTALEISDNENYSVENGLLISKNGTLVYATKGIKGALHLPEWISVIRPRAFRECNALTAVTVSSVQTIGDRAFEYCAALTKAEIDGVESVGADIFFGCNALEELTVPFIGRSALALSPLSYLFGGDAPSSLMSVTLTAQKVLDGTFKGCGYLTNVTMSADTRIIRGGAFEDCSSISLISIPDSVESIEDYSFLNCRKDIVLEVKDKEAVKEFAKTAKNWDILKKASFLWMGKQKAKIAYRGN